MVIQGKAPLTAMAVPAKKKWRTGVWRIASHKKNGGNGTISGEVLS